jgi:hypothetical protein
MTSKEKTAKPRFGHIRRRKPLPPLGPAEVARLVEEFNAKNRKA